LRDINALDNNNNKRAPYLAANKLGLLAYTLLSNFLKFKCSLSHSKNSSKDLFCLWFDYSDEVAGSSFQLSNNLLWRKFT